ncbi:MAG: c-type cytochrome [Pseudomonadota bacterium]
MRLFMLVFLGGVFLAGDASPQSPNEVRDGRKVAGMCRTCHSLNGFSSIPIAPHIGGEPVDYIINQLEAFRSGAREHEMMSVVAKGLSDTQIRNVAAWYGHFNVTATLPAKAKPEDAPELCVACHGVTGIAETDDAPNLAGETNIYIDTQLKAFRSGKRSHDIMSAIAADLTDTEIRDIADWYAAIKLEITAPQ